MNSGFFSAYSSKICPQNTRKSRKPFNIRQLAFVFLFLCLHCQNLLATNYYTEKQISRDLQQEIDKKEIIWLDSGEALKVIGLFKEAQGIDVVGSALILADLNHHPNWPHVIRPLRNDLADHGWNTLSIQMPIKEKQASAIQLQDIYDIAEKRIKSAIAYLIENEDPNIIIIGRRQSANIAIKYLAENKEENQKITAFISISSFDSPWINSSQLLREMPIAYMDVYAQNDASEVLLAAPKRLASAKFAGQMIEEKPRLILSSKVQELAKNKTGNLHFRQARINGAQPLFSQHESTLLKTIRGWLKNHEAEQRNKQEFGKQAMQ